MYSVPTGDICDNAAAEVLVTPISLFLRLPLFGLSPSLSFTGAGRFSARRVRPIFACIGVMASFDISSRSSLPYLPNQGQSPPVTFSSSFKRPIGPTDDKDNGWAQHRVFEVAFPDFAPPSQQSSGAAGLVRLRSDGSQRSQHGAVGSSISQISANTSRRHFPVCAKEYNPSSGDFESSGTAAFKRFSSDKPCTAKPVRLGSRAALPARCTNAETHDGSFHWTTTSMFDMLQPFILQDSHDSFPEKLHQNVAVFWAVCGTVGSDNPLITKVLWQECVQSILYPDTIIDFVRIDKCERDFLRIRNACRYHAEPQLAKDIESLMKYMSEHKVYTIQKGRTLDDDEPPVKDIITAGFHALTMGAKNPLAEYNEAFSKLQRRRRMKTVPAMRKETDMNVEKPPAEKNVEELTGQETQNNLDDISNIPNFSETATEGVTESEDNPFVQESLTFECVEEEADESRGEIERILEDVENGRVDELFPVFDEADVALDMDDAVGQEMSDDESDLDSDEE
ncbi:hypothetical protein D9613_009000 [Agrocybe pediades]|uniref:Uncharacterized protein n=1 Tax=Agrocybe pediades TaxID=84607 RepID=A0A8H4VU33_9AGAR|nr:hypothetical protein D9613_009000 [Agrocybe pediades]